MSIKLEVELVTDKFTDALARLKALITEDTRDEIRVWCSRNVNAMYILGEPIIDENSVTVEVRTTATFRSFIHDLERRKA